MRFYIYASIHLCTLLTIMSIAAHQSSTNNASFSGVSTYNVQQIIKNMARSIKNISRQKLLVKLEYESDEEIALRKKLLEDLKTVQGWQSLTRTLSEKQLINTHHRCGDIIARLSAFPPPSDTEKQLIDWDKIQQNRNLIVDLSTSIKKHIEVELSPPSFWRTHRTLLGSIAVAAISCIAYWLYTCRRASNNNEHSIEQAQEVGDD